MTPAATAGAAAPAAADAPQAPAPDIPETLTLQEALRLAGLRNPALAMSRAEADAAEADRLTAGLRPNPALTVQSSGYPLFGSDRPGFWNGQETTVRIDQELETAGRRRLRSEAAAAGAQAARLTYADRARELTLQIERAYFAAVLAQTDRGVAETTLAEIDKVIALNRARFEQGEISGAELRRLQVERLRFVDDLFNAELALKNAHSALLTVLNAPALERTLSLTEPLAAPRDPADPVDAVDATGRPIDGLSPGRGAPLEAGTRDRSDLRLADAGAAAPAHTADRADRRDHPDRLAAAAGAASQPAGARTLVEQALVQRPDAQAARIELQRADTNIRLQRALRMPNLTAGLGYLRDRRAGSNGNGIVASVSLPLPIFNRNQGGIARAEAERRAAGARMRAVEANVRLDLRQALDAVATSRARVRYIERESLTAAREARDIVFESYRVGAADLIDYLDAQRAFRDTLRTYNRALFDERISRFALAAAIGQTQSQP